MISEEMVETAALEYGKSFAGLVGPSFPYYTAADFKAGAKWAEEKYHELHYKEDIEVGRELVQLDNKIAKQAEAIKALAEALEWTLESIAVAGDTLELEELQRAAKYEQGENGALAKAREILGE